ncbi:MAG: hypothetical protein R3F19_24410 [Verrucomicrobiales bacterium]|nr:hypothetical protein [Verrucomicrobiae bacterium]
MKQTKLDAVLPRIIPGKDELHLHAAILETSDAPQLMELASDSKVRRFLLGRLSDTVALVDPGNAEELERALIAGGHTPKIEESKGK